MTFEIRKVRLGEVCEIKQGRYLAPSQMIHVPGNEGDVPVIGGNGILGYTTSTTHDFDVPLVTCRGSRCGLMQWGASPSWISNNAMAVWFKQGSGDNRFLFHYLRHADFDSVITGSAQPQITVTNLSNLEISLPESRVQVAIGNFMDSLEAKISINQGLSDTLEQFAQTIFKSWFIDFDPVHAKSLGEQPEGIDAETAALFPDSFEESELGLIPKGWKAIPLSEIAEFRNGLALQKYPAVEGEGSLPVIKIPQLKGNSVDGAGAASLRVPQKFVVDDGDILFSWSGALEVRFWSGGKGALNQHLFRVVPTVGDPWLSYFWVLQHLSWFREIAQSKATTMGHIQRGHLTEATVVVPGSQLLERAGAVIQPFIDLAVNKLVENRTLQSVRDALLPRLISGELEIHEELLVD